MTPVRYAITSAHLRSMPKTGKTDFPSKTP